MSYIGRYSRRSEGRGKTALALPVCVLLLALCILGGGHRIVPGASASDHGAVWDDPTDTIAPEISGVKDFLLYEGGTLAYRKGVTVTDDMDEDVKLTVDSSSVDLTKVGVYQVYYIAEDNSGNTASCTATVTVLPRKPSYQELDTIYQAADQLLAEIGSDQMTARQQVIAIYQWAQQNIVYSGHSDREDWLQTAYTVLQERKGDCFGYFAVTKLLFERLEIPNIDVCKVKNSPEDSEHFWSLVSVDGERSYLHFDATPRIGEGDDFCLVTDSFIDAYSDSHDGSHNRDRSLYPPTP